MIAQMKFFFSEQHIRIETTAFFNHLSLSAQRQTGINVVGYQIRFYRVDTLMFRTVTVRIRKTGRVCLPQKDVRLRSWRNYNCRQWIWYRSPRVNHDTNACRARETDPWVEVLEDSCPACIDEKHEAERCSGR